MARTVPRVTFDNHRNATIDDFHEDFASLWARDENERSVFDLWLHVVDHASRIGRAIRRQEPPQVIDDIADTTVWLMSFCAHCQRTSGTTESRFHFSEQPSKIIWQKYPGSCPACFDWWILSLIDVQTGESPIEKLRYKRDAILQAVESRTSQAGLSQPCTCLTRVASHARERDIISSLRTELDEIRIHYSEMLHAGGKTVSRVSALEEMFHSIYANVHYVLSLELTVFHLLEEVGEATEALKDVYTYDNSREPFSPQLQKLRKARVLDEIGDIFSWLFATALKIRSTYGRHAAQYHASVRPSEEALTDDVGLTFSDIIWSKYGTTRSGANWDRLRCPGCQATPCECPRDIRFDFGPISAAGTQVARLSEEKREMESVVERDLVFISYSHKDSEWLHRLQTMLKPLIRNKSLSTWDDKQIRPGERWRSEIDSALRRAKVAVLLVSPDFLASDFIAEKELPPLLDAATRTGTKILWIPVSASLYTETEIERYQAAHDPGKPLNSLSPAELDQALVKICTYIKEAAKGT